MDFYQKVSYNNFMGNYCDHTYYNIDTSKKGYQYLKQLLFREKISSRTLLILLGISEEEFRFWEKNNKIPSRYVSKLISFLNLEVHEVDLLLGQEPVKISIRKKRRER